MDSIIKFLAGLEIPVYVLLGVVGVVYLRRLATALEERRTVVFSLERQAAQRRVNESVSVMVLIGILTIAEFVVATFLVGEINRQPTYATATPTLSVVSPSPTGPIPTDATLTPTPYPQATLEGFTSACAEGVLEITSPRHLDSVSGVVELIGTVNTPNFGSYYYAYATPQKVEWQTIAAGSEVKTEMPLGYWYTSELDPGDYLLRLVALDNDGREQSSCIIQVSVEPAE
jgi:hypothetical protein